MNERENWDQAMSHVSHLLNDLTELQRMFAASQRGVAAKILNSEQRAASLGEAAKSCMAECALIIAAAREMEIMLEEIGWQGQNFLQKQHKLQSAILEAHDACAAAVADLTELATEIEQQGHTVSGCRKFGACLPTCALR